MSALTLYQLYRQQADRQGDAVAVRGLNAADLTYSGFIAQSERIIDALTAWGIGRGDRVLVQLPNGPEAFVTLHGVAALAVVLLVDLRAGVTEVDYFMRFVEPKAIIVQQGVESSGRTLAQQQGVRVIDILPTPQTGAGTFTFADSPPPLTSTPVLNGPDDRAFLIFTSGTTSLPKMVPRTQNGMLNTVDVPLNAQSRALGETLPLNALNLLPLHLLFGTIVSSAALASGGSVACMPGLDPNQFFQWLDVYRPTSLAGPPRLLEQCLMYADQNQAVLARHSIRHVNLSAAPLSEATRSALQRTFGVPIVHTYGMTEIACISQLILPAGSTEAIRTMGRVEHIDRTGILAPDGRFLPVGQVGEIVVRDALFSAYWNNPEANAESFVEGWFRTGDEGFIDENAHLTITGRIKEIINSGGAKVSPNEVETVLKQHPQVVDAAVFGLKNADLDETVAAAVVGTVSERELRKFASEQLPFYKVPMRIVLVNEIPRTALGKVQRNRLAELLGLA